MTYIDILNAFYSLLAVHPLSANAQALYLYLVHCNNKKTVRTSGGKRVWAAWFEVTNKQIMQIMGWTDRRRLYNAREELLCLELIDYQEGDGLHSSFYALNEEILMRYSGSKACGKPC